MANENEDKKSDREFGEAKAAREKAEAEKAKADAEASGKKQQMSGFFVADGVSITCKRGHIDAGGPVLPSDFNGGQKDLDDLVSRGAVTKL